MKTNTEWRLNGDNNKNFDKCSIYFWADDACVRLPEEKEETIARLVHSKLQIRTGIPRE